MRINASELSLKRRQLLKKTFAYSLIPAGLLTSSISYAQIKMTNQLRREFNAIPQLDESEIPYAVSSAGNKHLNEA